MSTACIYGIFDGKDCFYIGQTIYPDQRKQYHSTAFPKKQFKILRLVKPGEDKKEIEAQTIREFLRLGHNLKNVHWVPRPKTVTLRIPADLHTELKTEAAANGEKLGELVERILSEKWGPKSRAK